MTLNSREHLTKELSTTPTDQGEVILDDSIEPRSVIRHALNRSEDLVWINLLHLEGRSKGKMLTMLPKEGRSSQSRSLRAQVALVNLVHDVTHHSVHLEGLGVDLGPRPRSLSDASERRRSTALDDPALGPKASLESACEGRSLGDILLLEPVLVRQMQPLVPEAGSSKAKTIFR